MPRHAFDPKPRPSRFTPVRLLWTLSTLLLVATTLLIASSWFTTPRPTLVVSALAPSNRVTPLPHANTPQECYARGLNAPELPPGFGPVQLSQTALDSIAPANAILSAHQLSRKGIAGTIANGIAESGGDSTKVQDAGYAAEPVTPNLGYGTFMWTGRTYQDELKTFAAAHDLSAGSPQLQYEFFWQTLADAPDWIDTNGCHHDPLSDLKFAPTAGDAALVVCAEYIYREQWCGAPGELERRVAIANTVLSLLPA